MRGANTCIYKSRVLLHYQALINSCCCNSGSSRQTVSQIYIMFELCLNARACVLCRAPLRKNPTVRKKRTGTVFACALGRPRHGCLSAGRRRAVTSVARLGSSAERLSCYGLRLLGLLTFFCFLIFYFINTQVSCIWCLKNAENISVCFLLAWFILYKEMEINAASSFF